MNSTMDIETRYCAQSNHPLPVLLTCGDVVAQIQQVLGEMQPRRLASASTNA